MEMAVPKELRYSVTDARMPGFAKPLGVASDDMVADKVVPVACFDFLLQGGPYCHGRGFVESIMLYSASCAAALLPHW